MKECWGFIDSRTNDRVSVNTHPTRESAQRELDEWIERDRQGKRPDAHDVVPYIVVVRIW